MARRGAVQRVFRVLGLVGQWKLRRKFDERKRGVFKMLNLDLIAIFRGQILKTCLLMKYHDSNDIVYCILQISTEFYGFNVYNGQNVRYTERSIHVT